jgi:propanol-preferring alcohol dehydrogenase
VRGSIVGTRKDMTEALDFYARGLVNPTYTVRPLDDINAIFAEMLRSEIDGRVVMDMRG